jgi:hypothetical protein
MPLDWGSAVVPTAAFGVSPKASESYRCQPIVLATPTALVTISDKLSFFSILPKFAKFA